MLRKNETGCRSLLQVGSGSYARGLGLEDDVWANDRPLCGSHTTLES